MSLFSAIGNAFKAAVPVAKALTNFLPIPSIAKTALDMGIDAVAGGKLPSVTGLLGPSGSKLFAAAQNLPALVSGQVEAVGRALDSQGVVANAIRAARAAKDDALTRSIGAKYENDLIYSDDKVFSAISLVTNQTRAPMFGILLSSVSREVATPIATLAPFQVINYSTTTQGLAAVTDISRWVQQRFRDFFNTKSLFEITPVISVIQRLWDYAKNLDNPFDFYNFFGYNGPEVVSPLASMDVPVVNAILDKISRHKTTKSLEQWFAAVAHHKELLRPFRKIVADWLGSEAGDLPAFMLDMLTFYILVEWGPQMVKWIYTQDSTFEMRQAYSISRISSDHIYDIYDTLHYMVNSANASWLITFNATPSPATTDAQRAAYMLACYHLVVATNLLMVTSVVMEMSNFGVDGGDIADLHSSLSGNGTTDPVDYWEAIAAFCNHDNADLIRMGKDVVATAIAEATISDSEIVLLGEDDLISVTKIEGLIRELEQLSVMEMNSIQYLDFYRLCESAASNLEAAISGRRIDDPARAALLLTRVKAVQAAANSRARS